MKSIKFTLLFVLILCFLQASYAQDSKQKGDWRKLIHSPNEEDRKIAYEILKSQYSDTVEELMKILERPVKEGESFNHYLTPRNIAIQILGEMKAGYDLFDWLVPHEGQKIADGPVNSESYFPFAYTAIYETVEHAVEVFKNILDNISKFSVSTKKWRYCVELLKEILDDKVFYYLEKELEEYKEFAKAKPNDKYAKKYVENMQLAIEYLKIDEHYKKVGKGGITTKEGRKSTNIIVKIYGKRSIDEFEEYADEKDLKKKKNFTDALKYSKKIKELVEDEVKKSYADIIRENNNGEEIFNIIMKENGSNKKQSNNDKVTPAKTPDDNKKSPKQLERKSISKTQSKKSEKSENANSFWFQSAWIIAIIGLIIIGLQIIIIFRRK